MDQFWPFHEMPPAIVPVKLVSVAAQPSVPVKPPCTCTLPRRMGLPGRVSGPTVRFTPTPMVVLKAKFVGICSEQVKLLVITPPGLTRVNAKPVGSISPEMTVGGALMTLIAQLMAKKGDAVVL